MDFTLPELPYSRDALAPTISAQTLHFHYDKHHHGYMDKLRKALEGKPLAANSLEEIIRATEGSTFNFAAQVWNHTFYWRSMSPGGGGEPPEKLADMLSRHFGSVDGFKQTFAEAANGEFGSGWAWLVRDGSGSLRVLSSSDADNPLRRNETPLLTLDVWEHAYYLDYQNERDSYVQGFLDNLINWEFMAENLKGSS